jgi:hypothetical protein
MGRSCRGGAIGPSPSVPLPISWGEGGARLATPFVRPYETGQVLASAGQGQDWLPFRVVFYAIFSALLCAMAVSCPSVRSDSWSLRRADSG